MCCVGKEQTIIAALKQVAVLDKTDKVWLQSQ